MSHFFSRSRTAWIPIAAALALRGLGLIPFALDDDEAWFSTSGLSLGHPGQTFGQILDNKPPGMTWFYEAVARLLGANNLPILARASSLPLLLLGAYGCGIVASRTLDPDSSGTGSSAATQVRDITAVLMLLGISCFHPKILSLSNEILMIPAICAAYWLAGPKQPAWRWFLGGVLLGGAVLIKQTGIFFFWPVLLHKPRLANLTAWTSGLLLTTGLVAWHLGLSEFMYWNWLYPATVLVSAREKLFSGWHPALLNSGIFVAALAPLGLSFTRPNRPALFLWSWLMAACLAVIVGKGLFPHYYLLLVPPLAGLGGISWSKAKPPRWRVAWLWSGAVICSGLAAIPSAGLFWGNDLAYYRLLTQRIERITSLEKPWYLWGSNALPLAMTSTPSFGRFVTSRFLVPPYATPETLTDFARQFDLAPPEMLLDLHARGDNQFNFPLDGNPALARMVAKDYLPFADPALPWASFLLRKQPREITPILPGLCESRSLDRSTDYYPQSIRELKALLNRPFAIPWQTADRLLRIHFTLEILRNACPGFDMGPLSRIEVADRAALQHLGHGKAPESRQITEWEERVRQVFEVNNFRPPFALDNSAWWISLALVELQPVAKPR